jgi:hypothetical protein
LLRRHIRVVVTVELLRRLAVADQVTVTEKEEAITIVQEDTNILHSKMPPPLLPPQEVRWAEEEEEEEEEETEATTDPGEGEAKIGDRLQTRDIERVE